MQTNSVKVLKKKSGYFHRADLLSLALLGLCLALSNGFAFANAAPQTGLQASGMLTQTMEAHDDFIAESRPDVKETAPAWPLEIPEMKHEFPISHTSDEINEILEPNRIYERMVAQEELRLKLAEEALQHMNEEARFADEAMTKDVLSLSPQVEAAVSEEREVQGKETEDALLKAELVAEPPLQELFAETPGQLTAVANIPFQLEPVSEASLRVDPVGAEFKAKESEDILLKKGATVETPLQEPLVGAENKLKNSPIVEVSPVMQESSSMKAAAMSVSYSSSVNVSASSAYVAASVRADTTATKNSAIEASKPAYMSYSPARFFRMLPLAMKPMMMANQMRMMSDFSPVSSPQVESSLTGSGDGFYYGNRMRDYYSGYFNDGDEDRSEGYRFGVQSDDSGPGAGYTFGVV